jgi:histone-lysine N-methyltransferase SETDB1
VTVAQGGKNYGDEYLAELDYIEVVEKLKEGYESDVVEDDSDSPSDEKDNSEARRSKGKLEFDS